MEFLWQENDKDFAQIYVHIFFNFTIIFCIIFDISGLKSKVVGTCKATSDDSQVHTVLCHKRGCENIHVNKDRRLSESEAKAS